MSAPTTSQKSLAAAVFVAAVIGLYTLTRTSNVDVDKRHTVVPWTDGGRPASGQCLLATSIATQRALDAFGLLPDAGPSYCIARVCYNATQDAGAEVMPTGLDVLFGDEDVQTWDGGSEQVEVWCDWHQSAPWTGRCSTGSNCNLVLADGGVGAAAATGVTYPAAAVTGAGCYRKPLVEVSGRSSWPTACP